MSAKWTAVCNVSDLKPGLGVCALVDGVQVALFVVEGQIYALQNMDPFSKANVISRGISGDLQGRLVVASPIYKQHFDLETGECLEDAEVNLATFPVEVVDGQLLVAVSGTSVEAA
ncbi:MAG: nitrite reductase small subunit NirD [Endozoicomonas sp.]